MLKRGVFVGRFQPPHLGHLEAIQYILTDIDELIIVIAAAQISHTKKNPFTAGERITMMKYMLQNAGIPADKYWLIPAEDVMDNALWVAHLKRLLPPFTRFYGNNPFVQMLFNEAGFDAKSTPLINRENFEASKIRDCLINDEDITDLIDSSVLEYLTKLGIKSRLKAIVTKDSVSNKTKPGSELQNFDADH